MSNISFPKDMRGWSQRDLSSQLVAEQVDMLTEEFEDQEANFKLMIEHVISIADKLSQEIDDAYSIKSKKELYDAKIHLSLVKHLLRSV